MCNLLDRASGNTFPSDIVVLKKSELSKIHRSEKFSFDWRAEKNYEVYKVIRQGDDSQKALGLMSLVDVASELRIHVNLIENANENKGQNKLIDNVAGCLLAYAAQLAFERGYMGFVSLLPKTSLIPMYAEKYGFSQYGRNMAISGNESIELIRRFSV